MIRKFQIWKQNWLAPLTADRPLSSFTPTQISHRNLVGNILWIQVFLFGEYGAGRCLAAGSPWLLAQWMSLNMLKLLPQNYGSEFLSLSWHQIYERNSFAFAGVFVKHLSWSSVSGVSVPCMYLTAAFSCNIQSRRQQGRTGGCRPVHPPPPRPNRNLKNANF